MKNRLAIAMAALLLGNLPALPSHAEICEGSTCESTFEFTGEIAQFNVPIGVSSIDFEIYGASGGRGGLGGKVTGTLTSLPSSIYVVIGGAGTIGSQAAGGYNGGGQAGGYRTNEGSGGGASDLRLDLGLDSRIVVAGGGGGAGGFSGAPGGAGGAEIAANGQSGQGSGGGGGTQTSGGPAGVSNGGSASSAGAFGVGGTGGNSTNAGGGGGGGGWYGGGGGGADDDNCCSDGGGGGGGSSFAHTSYVSNAAHEAGVQLGNGRVVLRYTKTLVVTEFSGQQLDSKDAQFRLGLSMPNELSLGALDASALSCDQLTATQDELGWLIKATNCADGTQVLTIPQGAIDGTRPEKPLEAAIEFDAVAPVFSWQDAVIDHQADQLTIEFSLDEGSLDSSLIQVIGCQSVAVEQMIVATGCQDDQASVTIPVGAFTDQWGNSSPDTVLTQLILFDRAAPVVSVQNQSVDVATSAHSFEFVFSEAATFDVSRLVVEPIEGCEILTEPTENSLAVSGNCGFGLISYTVPALSLTDAAANTGPASDFVLEINIAEPQPEPEPEPEPEPAPEPEAEEQTPAPNAEVAEPSVPTSPIQQVPVRQEPVVPEIEPEVTEELTSDRESENESEANSDAETEPVLEPVIEQEEAISAGASDAESINSVDTGEMADPAEMARTEDVQVQGQPEQTDEVQATAPPLEQDSAVQSLPVATGASNPRLSQDVIEQGNSLTLWMIAAGSLVAVSATGYLAYRFIGR